MLLFFLTFVSPTTNGSISQTNTLVHVSETYNAVNAVQGIGFISIWNTSIISIGSSANNQIKLPLQSTGTYNFLVEWGDTNSSIVTAYNDTSVTHTYTSPGIYTINITGQIIGWQFNNGGDRLKIIEISQWGDLQLVTGQNSFYGASNLVLSATDALNLTGVTDLNQAFSGCSSLGSQGSMSLWDVSQITNFAFMFKDAITFNLDISSWNTSSGKDFSLMFFNATQFNQPLNTWNLSSALYISGMFSFASSFNQPLDSWSFPLVQGLAYLFDGATAFNQPLNSWDVSNVTSIPYILSETAYNYPLDTWDVSKVTDMSDSFSMASNFDQDLGSWNVSQTTVFNRILNGTNLSPAHYDSLLLGWSQLNLASGKTFDAKPAQYSSASASARDYIINTFGWVINDNGLIDYPSAPQTLQATFGNGSVYLMWNVPNSNGNSTITSYNIYRSTSSGSGYSVIGSTPNLFYNDSMVTHENYYYVVTAVNRLGDGSLSNEVSGIPNSTPSAPTVSLSSGDGYVAVTWIAPSNNGGYTINSYNIYRSTISSTGFVLLSSVSGSTLSYQDTSVSNGMTYYYRVSASNVLGEGSFSSDVPITLLTIQTSSSSTSTSSSFVSSSSSNSPTSSSTNQNSPGFEFVFLLVSLIGLTILSKKRRNN